MVKVWYDVNDVTHPGLLYSSPNQREAFKVAVESAKDIPVVSLTKVVKTDSGIEYDGVCLVNPDGTWSRIR